ncbi:MAG TPA: cation:proton antiporter [Candidatus Acidoferrales bacterium]|nr:cation:proton antiporter [Candidatus Acidoferrales bacterium]
MEQLWWDASVWVALALVSSLLSLRVGVSVALVELIVGIAAGNAFHPEVTDWINFLASFGAVILTFLAGAELESRTLRRFWKESLVLGLVGFFAPFALAWFVAQFFLGWDLKAAQIAGIALSTTSVAVVYAVMVETGLNETSVGKLILAACFVNDLGTVIALGLLFTSFGRWFWISVVATVLALFFLPGVTSRYLKRVNSHPSEPEVKYLYLILLVLAYLAAKGGSEGVLPAYLVGMVLADTFLGNRELIKRMRATTFALLTPFYFLKAGSLVDLDAVIASIGTVLILFLSKSGAKFVGLYPAGAAFRFTARINLYTTLMMTTGLTFGTISALYGLSHRIITQDQYSVLVVVVILTAIVPTLIAQAFFEPKGAERDAIALEVRDKGGKSDV